MISCAMAMRKEKVLTSKKMMNKHKKLEITSEPTRAFSVLCWPNCDDESIKMSHPLPLGSCCCWSAEFPSWHHSKSQDREATVQGFYVKKYATWYCQLKIRHRAIRMRVMQAPECCWYWEQKQKLIHFYKEWGSRGSWPRTLEKFKLERKSCLQNRPLIFIAW